MIVIPCVWVLRNTWKVQPTTGSSSMHTMYESYAQSVRELVHVDYNNASPFKSLVLDFRRKKAVCEFRWEKVKLVTKKVFIQYTGNH